MVATAVSSVGQANPCPLTFKSPALNLTDEQKLKLRQIDDAAMVTLRDCMQTVYEDGSRRDQQLWIGDLRLQALASYATYKDRDLVKQCLYLFAAMPFNAEGKLCACAYEEPEPHTGRNSISECIVGERRCSPVFAPLRLLQLTLKTYTVDYALLYTCTLLDYVNDSGDTATGDDLLKSLASNSTSPPVESAPTLSTKSQSRRACWEVVIGTLSNVSLP
jgi:alpha-L-rhamnosidase